MQIREPKHEIIFANIDFRIRHTLIVLTSHVAKLYPNMPLKQLSSNNCKLDCNNK